MVIAKLIVTGCVGSWSHAFTRCLSGMAATMMALLLPAGAPVQAKEPARRCWVPDGGIGPAVKRAITARDLVRLRDFGEAGYDGQPLQISPDRKRVALALRQADPDRNDYCSVIIEFPLAKPAQFRLVDNSGDIVRATYAIHGINGIPLGTPKPIRIAWHPNSRAIAFTKTFDDRSEIWLADLTSGTSRKIAASASDIDMLHWSAEGSRLTYGSRQSLHEISAERAKEERAGYHYDARFWPLGFNAPFALAATTRTFKTIPMDGGREVAASASDIASLSDPETGYVHRAADQVAFYSENRRAWSAPDKPMSFRAPARLHVEIDGKNVPCGVAACMDVRSLWWFDRGRRLLFLSHDKPRAGTTILYSWIPGREPPHPLLQTDAMLFGCSAVEGSLICARESSLQPRHIVAINATSGHQKTLFDPNPEFAGLALGDARRLHWTNRFGIETFGDLVLPPGGRQGRPLPLVVIQYDSHGFLRGGTADEYPVQLFAARGFAVLSFNRPSYYGLRSQPKDAAAFLLANSKDRIDRQNVQSSLEVIIARLVADGLVDPARVGITGQSDGASTATYALIHSNIFKAAALSTCCEDEGMMTNIGPGLQKTYMMMGYPGPGAIASDFWEESALRLHADRPAVPILIQAGSEEFRMALPTFETLKAHGWPIDMYVFADEGHVKFQPAHRLTVYQRAVDWMAAQLIDAPAGAMPRAESQASTSAK